MCWDIGTCLIEPGAKNLARVVKARGVEIMGLGVWICGLVVVDFVSSCICSPNLM